MLSKSALKFNLELVSGKLQLLVVSLLIFVVAACDDAKNKTKTSEQSQAAASVQNAQESVKEAPKAFKPQVVSDSEQMRILDISERSYDGGTALAVTFSTAVDASLKIQKYFEVEFDKKQVSGEWVLSESGKIAYFDNIEPNSLYRVKVLSKLPAANGKHLKKGGIGEIITRNVQAAVGFSGDSIFLSQAAQNGLPVTTINVHQVDVNYYRIDNNKISNILYLLNSGNAINRYRLRDLADMAEHLHFARYDLPAPKNKRRDLNLPIANIPQIKQAGVYLAVMSQVGDYSEDVMLRMFTVTDIGLHARYYAKSIEVFANSLATAKPLGDITISAVDNKGQNIASAQSNSSGRASLNLDQKQRDKTYLLIASDGKSSVSFIQSKRPALDISEFGRNLHHGFHPLEFFIYSPRDLYRPGEVVQFSALLRDQDGNKPQKAVPMPSVLRDATGKIVKKFNWQGDANAYYETDFTLPSSAATGNWRLEVKNTDGTLVINEFKVEEFMPERIKLEFDGSKHQWGETIKVKLNAMYLYGAVAAKNKVSALVSLRNEPHPIANLADFYFGGIKERISENIELEEHHLDEQGNTVLRIDNEWSQAKTPLAVVFGASVYETGGRAVSRFFKTVLMPARKMIGVRPEFGTQNPQQNSTVNFDLVYADENGEKFGLADVEVRLVKEDRDYYWEYSQNKGWHYQYNEKEYVVESSTVSIPKGELATVSFPVEYGYYRLEAVDSRSQIITALRFYAGYNWYENWQENQQAQRAAKPDKVSLAFDKESYLAGDKAVLSIVPPAGGESLVMVESDKVLWHQAVRIPKEGKKITIPIDKSWNRHDLYVSVVHLQPQQAEENITAKRAFGLLHLPLDRTKNKLQVSIDAPLETKPNQQQLVKVKIEGNNSSKAKVTLAAVDVGVLNITGFETPNPHRYFFEPRSYRTDLRDMYHQLYKLNDNQLAQQRFGGDMHELEQLNKGGKEARAQVKILALFSSLVNVDKDGYATIKLDLPDFNGKVRLMALAFNDNSYGFAEQEMTIAAPIVTQLSMPRFLAMGDESTFALDVHNRTKDTQNLTVNLHSDNIIQIEEPVRKLQLKPDAKSTLIYSVKAKHEMGSSEIKLNIDGATDFKIDRSWDLLTRPAYPAITERSKKWLQQNQSFSIATPESKNLLPESVAALLKLSTYGDLQLPQHLDYLLRYPYGCTEQSVSSTYPWLYADKEAMHLLGIDAAQVAQRAASIEGGLARIGEKRLHNGGYGLWSSKSPEEQWLTVYTAEFMHAAQQRGVNIDVTANAKTISRLQEYIKQANFGNKAYFSRYSDDKNHSLFADNAYTVYVLALYNKVGLGQLRTLQRKIKDAKTPLAIAHLGLAFHLLGDEDTAAQLFATAATTQRQPEQYYGDYGSDIRDTAQLIKLYLQHQVNLPQIAALSEKLAAKLKQREYLSTQERNAVFLAGLALESKYAKPWQADISFADSVRSINGKGTWAKKYRGVQLKTGLSLINKSQQPLLAVADYQGYSSAMPQKIDSEYFSVKRNYLDLQGKDMDIKQLQVGDLVVVTLEVQTGKKRIADLLVVDMLPAGLELENQNLDTAIKVGELNFNWDENSAVMHREYRDDRFVAALNAPAVSKVLLVYLARAVTPGVYQVPPTLAENMYNPQQRIVANIHPPITIKNP